LLYFFAASALDCSL